MKIQILHDLQQEINRLFIAGSKFAHQDPRLLKLIPAFLQLGEKAPVFSKIAVQIQALTNASADESAQHLADLSNIVYAILYTQAEHIPKNTAFDDETLAPILDIKTVKTDTTYLELKPIVEALTTSKSGRLEVIEQAYKAGKLSDFRLFPYINNALGDKYTDLAQFVAEKVIPSIGNGILPFLEESFVLEDKSEQVRRLNGMILLNSAKIPALVDTIMGMSLPNLQAAAINYLKGYPTNENLILALAKDKNKIVRNAAYHAIAEWNESKYWDFLYEIFVNTALKGNEDLVMLLSNYDHLIYNDQLISVLKEIIQHILDPKDDKSLQKSIQLLEQNIIVLAHKEDMQSIQLLEDIIKNESLTSILFKKNINGYENANLISSMLHVMNTWKIENAIAYHERLNTVIKPKENWGNRLLKNYFIAGFRYYTPEVFYEKFLAYFKKGWVNLSDLVFYDYEGEDKIHLPNQQSLDQKWESVIVEKIEQSKTYDEFNRYLIYVLDLLPNPNVLLINELIVRQINEQELYYTYNLMDWALERNTPDLYEIFYQRIANYKWTNSCWEHFQLLQLSIWKTYPIEYAPKFEAISLTNKNFKQGAEIAALIIAR